jgi:putative redox protein
MPTEKLRIENREGDILAGLLEMPEEGKPLAYGMFAHCFTCNKNYKGVRNISRVLSNHGIAVLALDFAGLGESEGEFSDTTFSSNVADLVSAAEYLADHYQPPKLLIGHSMGGAAALKAASRISSSRAVVTIGSPAEVTHLRGLLPAVFEKIERQGEADVNIGGVKFTLRKAFIDDLERQSIRSVVADLKLPLLVVHSAADATVEMKNAEAIFRAAGYPKALITLDNADHLLSSRRDSGFVGSLVAAWAERYLERNPGR